MKIRIFIVCLVICSFLVPVIASAGDWIIFTPKQKDGFTWFYDKNSREYLKNKSFLGIPTPLKDTTLQKMWIRASSDKIVRLYQIELNCSTRIAKMYDDNGKGIYNLPEIDYLYERPIPPDTVLDMLRRAVC
jgi:hypothetical protein